MPPRRLTPVPKDQPPQPPDLRESVKVAIEAMDWLKPSDQAMKALALRQAAEIEEAVERAELLERVKKDFAGDAAMFKRLAKLEAMCDATKVVGWLGPQLQGVLRDLGGAPASRAAMKPDKPVGGRLAELRAGTNAAGKHEA